MPPTPSLVITIDPEALEAFRAAMGRAVVAAADAQRALPRMLSPSEPCACGSCQARDAAQDFAQAVLGLTIQQELPSDEDAHASLLQILESCTPLEILAVRTALRSGELEGMSSVHCLLGRIAACRGQRYEDLRSAWGLTAIEHWVTALIHSFMTPQNNAQAALLDQWLTTYLDAHTLEMSPARPACHTVGGAGPTVFRKISPPQIE